MCRGRPVALPLINPDEREHVINELMTAIIIFHFSLSTFNEQLERRTEVNLLIIVKFNVFFGSREKLFGVHLNTM